jgi:UDP-N-acetylglucosamine diphosphorylase / glucose-1-phosphate thymidylyltransferase / UDP-N-acetylgalactosamine diphosphorylase / glucosamine-1-phosphate N-acetyltransferase / galactosamine-1-phosphate N-acetyltransferase
MSVQFVDFPDKAVPLTVDMSLGDCQVAGLTLREWQEKTIAKVEFTETLYVRSTAWVSEEDLSTAVLEKNSIVSQSKVLASWNKSELAGDAVGVESDSSFEIFYAWDLIKVNEQLVGSLTENCISGEVSPAANVEGFIEVGEGTRILPGVFIEGNVIIGKNCKIGPNCYIRGNTFIGDNCHIGQSVEIKNSVIMTKTNVGHLSYVGDSVLGFNVNLGAGTTTSNLRHDNGNHKSLIDGELVDTGRRKFGIVIGNGVHTGINTSLYPGRKLWPNTTTLPGEVLKKDKM